MPGCLQNQQQSLADELSPDRQTIDSPLINFEADACFARRADGSILRNRYWRIDNVFSPVSGTG